MTSITHRDLFTIPKEYFFVHYVTADLDSKRGILLDKEDKLKYLSIYRTASNAEASITHSNKREGPLILR